MSDAALSKTRWTLAVYVFCFSIGALNHGHDFVRSGWRPYRWASSPLEVFWTSLIVLDLAVVGLLISGHRRPGLSLAAIVMILDVAANTYALLALEIPGFAVSLLLRTAFFGFILGSIGFLWPVRNGELASAASIR